MSVKNLMAVDLGASGGKCFAGRFEDGSFSMRELHRFAHEGTSFFTADRTGSVSERTVWDDTFIFRNIVEGLHAFRRECGASLDAIGVDTWGADGHLISADGDLLGKVYCYRDHRLDRMIEQVKARMDARRIYEITGIHFQPFNVSNQLLWLVENRPGLLLPGVTYLPVPSLFMYYLCGEKAVDSSWASVTQVMDARGKVWSREILKALGVPESIMPRIVPPGTVVGSMTAALAAAVGLNRAAVVAVAAHDTASAFAAAPIANPDDALIISAGTWSLVGKLVPEPITSDAAMQANLSNEGGIGNVRFLKNCMGGWLVQELRRVWRQEDGKELSWKEMDAMTMEAGAFQAFIDPDDPTFYNPANMQEAIVAFCRRTGQGVPQGRGGLMRVVYESQAMKYRMVSEQIGAVCGHSPRVVNIVGGGSKNIMLNQFTADATRLPVLAGPEEATAVGNLMTQAMGMGLIGSLPEAQPIIRAAFPIKEYQPTTDSARWEAAYGKFRRIVA